jgi:hypothetical protein
VREEDNALVWLVWRTVISRSAGRRQHPCARLGGRIGILIATDYLTVTGAKGVAGPVVALGIASQGDVDQAIEQAATDLNSQRYRGIAPFHITYGQRVRWISIRDRT